MNNQIFILVAVASQLLVKAETGDHPGILNLTDLGQVEGKNYFYERGKYQRNWTTAGNYCKESGMELATIESMGQAEFLRSKYSKKFHDNFWISARDAHLPRQFTWNTTGLFVYEISGLPWSTTYLGNMGYRTCILYFAATSPVLNLFPCSSTTSGVLCQT